MRTRIAVMLLGACLLVILGCSSARRSEPLRGALVVEGEAARGQVLFMRHCNRCHPGGAGGLGPAINDKPLPSIIIRTQIRNGAGMMPRFDSSELTDDNVDNVIEYLEALRRHD